jgi:excinuclease ABC subunit B
MRTEYDLEMMEEMGFCSGIENYSRHIAARRPGRGRDAHRFLSRTILLVLDESHVTVPQIGGMFAGDLSRKRFWWSTVSGCRARWTTGR